jgi:hypothetical protein
VILCSLLQIYQGLGGIYCYHLRGRRVSKPRREHGRQGEKYATVRVSQGERGKNVSGKNVRKRVCKGKGAGVLHA